MFRGIVELAGEDERDGDDNETPSRLLVERRERRHRDVGLHQRERDQLDGTDNP